MTEIRLKPKDLQIFRAKASPKALEAMDEKLGEKVVSLPTTRKTLNELVESFRNNLTLAAHYKAMSSYHRLQAALELGELRDRVEAGEVGEGVDWWTWFDANVVGSRSNAEKLLKISRAEDPQAELERQKQRDKEASQRYRDTSDDRGGNGGEPQPEDEDGDSEQVIWRRGLMYRAQEAIDGAAFEDWSHLKVDLELVQQVKRAANSWNQLATYMENLYAQKVKG